MDVAFHRFTSGEKIPLPDDTDERLTPLPSSMNEVSFVSIGCRELFRFESQRLEFDSRILSPKMSLIIKDGRLTQSSVDVGRMAFLSSVLNSGDDDDNDADVNDDGAGGNGDRTLSLLDGGGLPLDVVSVFLRTTGGKL